MEFRVDFFFRIVMDCFFYIVQLAFFTLVFGVTSALGGLNFDQVIIFAAGIMFVDAVSMTVFANNMWFLPMSINNGDLDYYLVRPVSSIFFLSLREFAANSFINLFIATGILIWALARYPEPLGAFNIGLYLIFLFMGVLIHYMLQMIFTIPTFWLHSHWGLRNVFYQLDKWSQRPHQIFTGWVRRTIVSIMPLALIISMPTLILFEGFRLDLIGHFLLVFVLLALFMRWFWNLGLRNYASASS